MVRHIEGWAEEDTNMPSVSCELLTCKSGRTKTKCKRKISKQALLDYLFAQQSRGAL